MEIAYSTQDHKSCVQFGRQTVPNFLLLPWELLLQPEYRKQNIAAFSYI